MDSQHCLERLDGGQVELLESAMVSSTMIWARAEERPSGVSRVEEGVDEEDGEEGEDEDGERGMQVVCVRRVVRVVVNVRILRSILVSECRWDFFVTFVYYMSLC